MAEVEGWAPVVAEGDPDAGSLPSERCPAEIFESVGRMKK